MIHFYWLHYTNGYHSLIHFHHLSNMLSPDQIFYVRLNAMETGVCFVSIKDTFNIPQELEGAVWPIPGEGWSDTLVDGKRLGDVSRNSGVKLREMDADSFIVCRTGNPIKASSIIELKKYSRNLQCILYEEAPSELLDIYMDRMFTKREKAAKRAALNPEGVQRKKSKTQVA